MKYHLKWFQIRDFRSLKDSGRCYVGDDITVLAGKNESGKSNILEALMCWSNDEFKDEVYPNTQNPGEPSVTVCFVISKEDVVNAICTECELQTDYKFESDLDADEFELTVQRFAATTQTIAGKVVDAIEGVLDEEFGYWNDNVTETMTKISVLLEECVKDDIGSLVADDKPLGSEVTENFISKVQQTQQYAEAEQSVIEQLEELFSTLKSNSDMVDTFVDADSQAIVSAQLPTFIFFSSFDDNLPSMVDRTSAAQNVIVKKLFKILGMKPDDIFSESVPLKRRQLADRTSTNLTGDFGGFYSQDAVKLEIGVDGDTIQFYVYDSDNPVAFHPKHRSQGFLWFLAFYITLNADGLDENCCILIDEPGHYLHPKAQQDLMKVLEKIALANQIIFTTHSPYLIDKNRLDRVRLVLKDSRTHETTIENKIHKSADKETLTPIITAIGLDLSHGIGSRSTLNVITEGISEYYYLHAMFSLLHPKQVMEYDIVPAVGVDQIPNLASILFGWGIPVAALLDNDVQGRGVEKRLRTWLRFEVDREILFVSSKDRHQIEDLFSRDDFMKYVLQGDQTSLPNNALNSTVANKRSKAVLAKEFHDYTRYIGKEDLSKETIQNFEDLFSIFQSLLDATRQSGIRQSAASIEAD